jgi:Flp pilus assembly pilin Flp
MNDLAVKTYVMLALAPARVRSRLADERGQTAAEYLGIIAVIAVIIGVLTTTDIGETLRGNIVDLIDEVFDGGR